MVWTAIDTAQRDVRDLSLEAIEQQGGLRPAIGPALAAIDRADTWAHSPAFAPLQAIPVVGTQVEGVQSMVARLATVADAGDRALQDVEGGLADAGAPGGRVRLLTTALEAIDRVEAEVASLPRRDASGLVGPVRAADSKLQRELDDLPERFGELRDHLETARDVLRGPTRVLLLAANNAEMRAGMGMHLSAGVITIEDGDFEASPFFATGSITERTQGRADVPADLEALYGEIWDFGHEWRTTSTTPDFPTVGRIIDQLAELSPIGEVDMVVSLDVPALAMLLDATGPVESEGELVSSANAVDLLLRDNYLRLGDPSETKERRDLQSRIAGTIFETVTERDLDVVDLAAELTRAAEGRHLMGWSDDPDVQALWESLGADGALGPTSFLVAAQNATASKRDYYLDPEVTVVPVGEPADGMRRYRATLSLENPVVSPTAPYVDSLNRFVPTGIHRAFVSFTLPGVAEDIAFVAGTPSRIGTDGPTAVATSWIRVPEGERRRATIEFSLPTTLRQVELVPGARVRPTTYRFGPELVSDTKARAVRLPVVAEIEPVPPQPLAAGALIVAFAGIVLLVARSRRLAGPEPDTTGARTDARAAAGAFTVALALALLAAVT